MTELYNHYRAHGYAVARGVFSGDDIARVAAACDQLWAEGVAHGRDFRHGNLFYRVLPGPGGPRVAMAQWPAYHQPVMDAVRRDPRYAALLEPLIGGDVKQIIHQVHWKARGLGHGGDFAWHQDSRSRRPAEAYRDLAANYVQTGLAIDPHTVESGALRVVPGSHHRGDLKLHHARQVLGDAMSDAVLTDNGIDPASAVPLLLEPGDVALWSPYLLHASGENRSGHARRLLINGYVRADACDRGEWTFRAGRPVPLGPEPALVHYEALRERPEPHYP